jgi:hypothetical protein
VAVEEAPNPNVPLLVLLVLIQVIYVCMIYGPIAAYLVEAFPARIRYTVKVCRPIRYIKTQRSPITKTGR